MRLAMTERRRIGIFGWGLVAPKSPNVDVFERNLESAEADLTPPVPDIPPVPGA